jgi:hypothetical protein
LKRTKTVGVCVSSKFLLSRCSHGRAKFELVALGVKVFRRQSRSVSSHIVLWCYGTIVVCIQAHLPLIVHPLQNRHPIKRHQRNLNLKYRSLRNIPGYYDIFPAILNVNAYTKELEKFWRTMISSLELCSNRPWMQLASIVTKVNYSTPNPIIQVPGRIK